MNRLKLLIAAGIVSIVAFSFLLINPSLLSMGGATAHRDIKQAPEVPDKTVDYRASPEGKLAAAKHYVDDFLVQDANPEEVFGLRMPLFPVWKDQPIRDCDAKGIVRWIEAREPYFESKKQDVVVVPVWAELLMIDVEGDDMGWGQDRDEHNKSLCKWEYERYNPDTQKFERLPQFRTRSYVQEFSDWGEFMEGSRSEYWKEHDIPAGGFVAIDPDKRIVRYLFGSA